MNLTKEQCHNIKGYAIFIIMVHNFVDHLLGINCNEMYYTQYVTDAFVANLFTKSSIWYIFSFAGWIGVAPFLFLSGYGLTKKYGNQKIEYAAYCKYHIIKLLKLLVPVYLLYVLVSCLVFETEFSLQSFIAHLTFTINFFKFDNSGFIIDPGVYWFFGAILQFYLIFPIIKNFSTKKLWIIVIAFVLIYYFNLYVISNDDFSEWTRHNFIGWTIPFILGMIAARGKLTLTKSQSIIIFPISLILLFICLTHKILTPFTEVLTIISFISFVHMFTLRAISFLGIISASLFVIHPFVRMVFYNSFDASEKVLVFTLAYLFISILLAYLHDKLLKRLS